MSDTPQTDALCFLARDETCGDCDCVCVRAEFSRRLERELSAATRERDEELRLLAEARRALDDIRMEGGGCDKECELQNGQACADIAAEGLLLSGGAEVRPCSPLDRPCIGTVRNSRFGVYVEVPDYWAGQRVRVEVLRDGGANAGIERPMKPQKED